MNAYVDLIERVFWTFVAAFLGLAATNGIFNFGVDWQDQLTAAAGAGLGTTAKVIIAFAIGKSSGGQLLPPGATPTVEVKPDTP